MYLDSGFLTSSKLPIKDKSKPLLVSCCGTYRLITHEKLPTWRPRGRLDYQLLYVAAGKTHFLFREGERTVPAGHMVLYLPRQEQHYEYFAADRPEVYWVHFTGGDVKNILRHYGIPLTENVFYAGVSSVYSQLFRQIMYELQSQETGFDELTEMYLRQILLLAGRDRQKQQPAMNGFLLEEMNLARRYFHEHYNEPICIEEYARSHHMSVSWFLRNFKQVTGISPMQYVLALRMNNAQNLLETTDYNVAEIASIVGYDNPLYFSRLFRKQKGVAPSEYRKLLHNRDGDGM